MTKENKVLSCSRIEREATWQQRFRPLQRADITPFVDLLRKEHVRLSGVASKE